MISNPVRKGGGRERRGIKPAAMADYSQSNIFPLSVAVYKYVEVVLKVFESVFELLKIVVEPFMIVERVIIDLSVVELHFCVDLLLMRADGMFEIVDVQLLDVELIVEVIDLDQYVFGRLFACHFLQAGIQFSNGSSVGTQCLPPGIAFS